MTPSKDSESRAEVPHLYAIDGQVATAPDLSDLAYAVNRLGEQALRERARIAHERYVHDNYLLIAVGIAYGALFTYFVMKGRA